MIPASNLPAPRNTLPSHLLPWNFEPVRGVVILGENERVDDRPHVVAGVDHVVYGVGAAHVVDERGACHGDCAESASVIVVPLTEATVVTSGSGTGSFW